jgi:hypothetical protein
MKITGVLSDVGSTPILSPVPAAVVNHLHFREPPDPALFARAQTEVVPMARSIEGFLGLHIVEAAPDHFILVIFGEDAAALDRVATEVGSPWMTANVASLLASPPERHLGPLVASTA